MRGRYIRLIALAGVVAALITATVIHPGAYATVPVINELVSANTSGQIANDRSDYGMSVSSDGNYVVFGSLASDLVSGDTNNTIDVFLRNRTSGTTTRVDVTPSGGQESAGASGAQISYTGRYVVFNSSATDLTGDTVSGSYDNIFIRDLSTNTTTLVSKNASGTPADAESGGAVVSADGRYVAFSSMADNLVSGVNPYGLGSQIFIKDMVTGNVQVLSVSSTGTLGDAPSLQLSMDCDGKVLAFFSAADNLVSGDTNGYQDVFMVKLGWSGNVISDITQSGNGASSVPAVSCDGNKIAYSTNSSNYPSGSGIYEYDRLTGTNTLVSQDNSATSAPGSYDPSISDDGRFVAFDSPVSMDSLDTNGNTDPIGTDIYIRDIKNNTTQLISQNTTDAVGRTKYTALSADGAYVTYTFQEAQYSSYGYLVGSGFQNSNPAVYISKTGF